MGLAIMGIFLVQAAMSATIRRMYAGPAEQFTPTAAAPRLSSTTAAVFASVPYKVLASDSKVMVTITGSWQVSFAAINAARASARLIIVSTTSRSTPASAKYVICSL